MEYLGLEPRGRVTTPEPNQVPREKLEALRKVLVWIYGSKQNDTRPAVRSQNPDIKRLGEVLAHAQGRHVLETTGDLDAAHASTEPVDQQFTASLIRARDNIRDAAGRSEPMTGVTSRCSTSRRTSRKRRKSCTRAWRRSAVKRVPPNDDPSLSSIDDVTGASVDFDRAADFLELTAFFADDCRALVSDLANQAAIGAADDHADLDEEMRNGEEELVSGTVERIGTRQQALDGAYPFEFDRGGDILTCILTGDSLGQAAYILSLVLSNLKARVADS